MESECRLIIFQRPFGQARKDFSLPSEKNISELLRLAEITVPDDPPLITLDEERIPAEKWSEQIVLAGQTVVVMPTLRGGDDGIGKILSTLIVIAAVVLSAGIMAAGWGPTIFAGKVALGSLAATMGLNLLVALAVNALIAPPTRRQIAGGPVPELTGARNQIRPFEPVAKLYGKFRYVPALAAKPVTEIVGNDQYLRLLFNFGFGPVEISELKIGETPIEEFSDVSWYIDREPVRVEQRSSVLRFTGAGVQSHISITHHSVLNLTPPCTIEFGFRLLEYGPDPVIPLINKGAAYRIALVRVRGVAYHLHISYTLSNNYLGIQLPEHPIRLGADYFVSVIFTRTECRVYLNGVFIRSRDHAPVGIISTNTDALLFARMGSHYFNGLLREVRFWNSARTAEQIFNMHACFAVGDEPDIVGYWPLDEINQARDLSRHTNHGVMTGVVWSPFTLIPDVRWTSDIHEESPAVLLRQNVSTVRVTQNETREISVDITYPHGVRSISSEGDVLALSPPVSVRVEYRLAGTEAWQAVIQFIESGPSLRLIRNAIAWNVPAGQYEVRVTKHSPDYDQEHRVIGDVYWSALRSVRHESPVQLPGVTLLHLRIRANEQLMGVVDTLSAMVQALLPVWNGQTWNVIPTRNPAWAFLDVFCGSANRNPILRDTRMDLPALLAWAARCDEMQFHFDGACDFRSTVFEVAKTIASIGRASYDTYDGLHSVIEDVPQGAPVQHFTPRNSWGFRGSKILITPPHALKIKFTNPERDWQQDEWIVYRDGYSEAGGRIMNHLEQIVDTLPATEFEALDLSWGVVDTPDKTSAWHSGQVWKLGRYYLAVGLLRPEVYEMNVDFENLRCRRGDLVRVSHDVPLWGSGWARVKNRTQLPTLNQWQIDFDDEFTQEAEQSYRLRWRTPAGDSRIANVLSVPGTSRTLILIIPDGIAPSPGDLAMFGVLGQESVECIVRGIIPDADLSAKIILIDYSPEIFNAATGIIPEFNSRITIPPELQDRRPTVPVIAEVQSDEELLYLGADGQIRSRIVLTLSAQTDTRIPIAWYELQYRRTDRVDDWVIAPQFAVAGLRVEAAPVIDGVEYELRVRAISTENRVSDWAYVLHTVIGKTLPPPDVVNPQLNSNVLSWSLTPRPLDVAGFLIRCHPGNNSHWSSAYPLHDGVYTESSMPIRLIPGRYTFLIRAIDTSHNTSVNAASVAGNIDRVADEATVGTWNYNANQWGRLAPQDQIFHFHGGTYDSVNRHLIANPVGFWTGDDSTAFWSADTTLFWAQRFSAMSVVLAVPWATMNPNGWRVTLTMTVDIESSSYRMEFRNPEVDTAWQLWPGAAQMDGEFPIRRLRVALAGGRVRGRIRNVVLSLSVPYIYETQNNIEIIMHQVIPFQKTFREIDSVQITLGTHIQGIAAYAIIESTTTTGVQVALFDTTGAHATGTISSLNVKGY